MVKNTELLFIPLIFQQITNIYQKLRGFLNEVYRYKKKLVLLKLLKDNTYRFFEIKTITQLKQWIKDYKDKKYDKTPIRELPKIYIISTYNGKVSSVCPKDIKNLKHFAWFRSEKDAEFARKCVIGLITDMFGKDDQSKD